MVSGRLGERYCPGRPPRSLKPSLVLLFYVTMESPALLTELPHCAGGQWCYPAQHDEEAGKKHVNRILALSSVLLRTPDTASKLSLHARVMQCMSNVNAQDLTVQVNIAITCLFLIFRVHRIRL